MEYDPFARHFTTSSFNDHDVGAFDSLRHKDLDLGAAAALAFGRTQAATGMCERPQRDDLIRLATQIYKLRQSRISLVDSSLFGEPVWDILLALYCQPPDKPKLSVSKLCYASGVPPTTALRWAQIMETGELIQRWPDPHDARRYFVTLSTKGEQFMDRLFRQAWPALVQS